MSPGDQAEVDLPAGRFDNMTNPDYYNLPDSGIIDITAGDELFRSSVEEFFKSCGGQPPDDKRLQALKDLCREILMSNKANKLKILIEYFKSVGTLGHGLMEILMVCIEKNYVEVIGCVIKFNKPLCTFVMREGCYEGLSLFHYAIVMNRNKLICAIQDVLDGESDGFKRRLLHLKANVPDYVGGADAKGRALTAGGNNGAVPELPLSLAAVLGHTDIMHHLVGSGAELAQQDSKGNNILHSIVYSSVAQMEQSVNIFKFIMNELLVDWAAISERCTFLTRMPPSAGLVNAKRMLCYARNIAGYTPLSLAAKMGCTEMMQEIMNVDAVYRFQHCSVGPYSTALYDATEAETALLPEVEGTPILGMLEIIIFQEEKQSLYSLISQPLWTLTNQKISFTMPYLLGCSTIHFLIMITYNWVAYYTILPHLYTPFINESLCEEYDFNNRFTYQVWDYCLLFIALCYSIVFGQLMWTLYGKMWRRNHLRWSTILSLSHVLQAMTICPFIITTLLYLILKICKSHCEVIFLSMSMFFGWWSTFCVTRAFKASGFFVLMLEKVFLKEVIRFLVTIIMTVTAVVMGFLCLMAADYQLDASPLVSTLDFIINSNGFTTHDRVRIDALTYRGAAVLYIVFFMLMVDIMLRNLLIASMNNTYREISDMANILCTKVQLRDVIVAEMALHWWSKRLIRKMYTETKLTYTDVNGIKHDRKLYLVNVKQYSNRAAQDIL